MMITMTRRLAFSAAHADWLPHLTQQENQALFGQAASPEPYGHNYVLEVGVTGKIDPKTGMLVNIKVIDKIAKEHIIQVFDKKFINHQVPAFEGRPVTAETLATYIAESLAPQLPPEAQLTSIRLEQTPQHWVEWHAQKDNKEHGTMLVTRSYEFAASHRLHSPHLSDAENRELFGKCNYENGHGHNYIVEVTVSGPINARSGRVLDPDILDTLVNREVIDRYDHRHLNLDVPDFADDIPSAEVITRVIWKRLRNYIPAPARLHRVLVRETARNIFETYGEDEEAQ